MSDSMRANDFVGTIGVNVRLAFTDGGYAKGQKVLAALQYLGVNQVRDAAVWTKLQGQASYALLAKAGVKFDMVLQSGRDPGAAVTEIAKFGQLYPGAVASVEGPNEINLKNFRYGALTGVNAGVAFVNAAVGAVNAKKVLRGTKIYDLTGANVADNATVSNVHLYPCNGNQPRTLLSTAMANQSKYHPGRDVVITETGYLTGTGNSQWEGVDQATQAKLTLNMLADAAALGYKSTYLFQLLDAYPDPAGTGIDKHMGLFDLSYQPKQAATAIHNLTSILADPGADATQFQPHDLLYTLANIPADASSLLLEKANGVHDIMLWREPDIWDEKVHKPIAAQMADTIVDFGSQHMNVQLFDPLVSDKPIAAYGDVSSVHVGLTDHPLIVQVSAVQR